EERVGCVGQPEHDELTRPDRGGDVRAVEADAERAVGEADVFADTGGAVEHGSDFGPASGPRGAAGLKGPPEQPLPPAPPPRSRAALPRAAPPPPAPPPPPPRAARRPPPPGRLAAPPPPPPPPPQPHHLVPQLRQHPPDLTVLPLRQHHPQPGAVALRLEPAD